MSVKAMAWVWDQEMPRDEKFVLLAYADHADHEGYNVFPAVDSVAKKTGYTKRSIQLITKKLIESGWLIPDGKSEYQTNKYSIPIYGGEKISPPTNGDDDEGVKNLHEGGENSSRGGVKKTARNVSQISPEPSFKPSINNHQEEPLNNNQPFSELLDAFINESQIPALGINPRDVEAGQRMVDAGVTPGDVISAVRILQEKKYQMVGLASVEKTAYNAMTQRVGAEKRDPDSEYSRSRYAAWNK